MNINTGEMVELSEEMKKLVEKYKQEEYLPRTMFPNSPPTKRKDVVEIAVGDIVDVKGCPCKIVHINTGKRRFTLMPVGKFSSLKEP